MKTRRAHWVCAKAALLAVLALSACISRPTTAPTPTVPPTPTLAAAEASDIRVRAVAAWTRPGSVLRIQVDMTDGAGSSQQMMEWVDLPGRRGQRDQFDGHRMAVQMVGPELVAQWDAPEPRPGAAQDADGPGPSYSQVYVTAHPLGGSQPLPAALENPALLALWPLAPFLTGDWRFVREEVLEGQQPRVWERTQTTVWEVELRGAGEGDPDMLTTIWPDSESLFPVAQEMRTVTAPEEPPKGMYTIRYQAAFVPLSALPGWYFDPTYFRDWVRERLEWGEPASYRQQLRVEEAKALDDIAVYWLGESFQGHQVYRLDLERYLFRSAADEVTGATYWVSVTYAPPGFVPSPGEPGGPPVRMFSYHLPAMPSGQRPPVRRGIFTTGDSSFHAEVELGDTYVWLSGESEAQVRAMLAALQRFN